MSLIHINRKIFNKLKSDEELVKEYLMGLLISLDKDSNIVEAYDTLTEGLYTIISKNESLITKVGLKNYYNSIYEVEDYVEGYWNATGKYALIGFDWSMDEENDEDWDYSFSIFKVVDF